MIKIMFVVSMMSLGWAVGLLPRGDGSLILALAPFLVVLAVLVLLAIESEP